MTDRRAQQLSELLTESFTAIPGVRSIFPDRPSGAVALRLLGGGQLTQGAVRISETEGESEESVVVSARLATDRTTPTRDVIAAAASAVERLVGPTAYELQLEFAYID